MLLCKHSVVFTALVSLQRKATNGQRTTTTAAELAAAKTHFVQELADAKSSVEAVFPM